MPAVAGRCRSTEVTGIVEADRSSKPFATDNQCSEGVVLNAREPVDHLHIALAPVEYCFSCPVSEIIESQFLQGGGWTSHATSQFSFGRQVCHYAVRLILHSHSTLHTQYWRLFLFSPFVLCGSSDLANGQKMIATVQVDRPVIH